MQVKTLTESHMRLNNSDEFGGINKHLIVHRYRQVSTADVYVLPQNTQYRLKKNQMMCHVPNAGQNNYQTNLIDLCLSTYRFGANRINNLRNIRLVQQNLGLGTELFNLTISQSKAKLHTSLMLIEFRQCNFPILPVH